MGATARAALDALTAQLPADEGSTLIIVQHFRPDQYCTATQQHQLETLMIKWRAAQATGTDFSATEQAELEALIDAELAAVVQRSTALADTAKR